MKKRIGIIGFGEMGKRHALEFYEATMGAVTVAGVVEPNDEMYENGCAWNKCDIPRYNTVAELLEKDQTGGQAQRYPYDVPLPLHRRGQDLYKGGEYGL